MTNLPLSSYIRNLYFLLLQEETSLEDFELILSPITFFLKPCLLISVHNEKEGIFENYFVRITIYLISLPLKPTTTDLYSKNVCVFNNPALLHKYSLIIEYCVDQNLTEKRNKKKVTCSE